MSIMQGRGGHPFVFLDTIDTTGRKRFFPSIINFLKIRVTTFPCKVYFTEDDFDNDANFITVPVAAAATPHGEWEGPAEVTGIWLKGLGGSSVVEVVGFQRRG